VEFTTEPNATGADGEATFWPFKRIRDPGEAMGGPRNTGLEHRIGGLEKQDGIGTVSYGPRTTMS